MAYGCRVLADSVNPVGCRLSTLELSFPRIVLAELNTHRVLSRNSASSRAIPVERQIARVEEDPFVPIWWGKAQRGMQAHEELGEEEKRFAVSCWLAARNEAVVRARRLLELGAHKQIASRLLEPWMWQTVIVSATTWTNFLGLRCPPGDAVEPMFSAQPEIQQAALLVRAALAASTPRPLARGEWHLPFDESDPLVELLADVRHIDPETKRAMVSAGRCARVSYLTHAGHRDPVEDFNLAKRLADAGHWSPFEHVAFASDDDAPSGNFKGFVQFRKLFGEEHIGGRMP